MLDSGSGEYKFQVDGNSGESGIGDDSGGSKGRKDEVKDNGAADTFNKPACNQQTNRQEDWLQARDNISSALRSSPVWISFLIWKDWDWTTLDWLLSVSGQFQNWLWLVYLETDY